MKSLFNKLKGINWPTLIIGAIFAILINVGSFELNNFLEKPDYGVTTKICTTSKIETSLVNVETGETTLVNGVGFVPTFVEFKNTGKKSLKNINFYIEFLNGQKNFKLESESINTIPPKGFGKISKTNENSNTIRLEIELFNPGDEVFYHVVSNYTASIITYSKTDGLSYYRETSPRCY